MTTSVRDSSHYDLQRAQDLLAQARAQCERRTEQRDQARVIAQRLAEEAAFGRALLDMLEQIRRLRRTPCPTQGFGFEIEDIEGVVENELAETRDEIPGSPRARAESIDLLGGALHLALVHHHMSDAGVLAGMLAWIEKIRRRLDHVDAGGTWAEAKRNEKHKPVRLEGADAIEYAEHHGLTLTARTLQGDRAGVTVAEAHELAVEDPWLVYLDIEAETGAVP